MSGWDSLPQTDDNPNTRNILIRAISWSKDLASCIYISKLLKLSGELASGGQQSPKQKRFVENRLRFSNVQYEVFPEISWSLAPVSARGTAESLSKRMVFYVFIMSSFSSYSNYLTVAFPGISFYRVYSATRYKFYKRELNSNHISIVTRDSCYELRVRVNTNIQVTFHIVRLGENRSWEHGSCSISISMNAQWIIKIRDITSDRAASLHPACSFRDSLRSSSSAATPSHSSSGPINTTERGAVISRGYEKCIPCGVVDGSNVGKGPNFRDFGFRARIQLPWNETALAAVDGGWRHRKESSEDGDGQGDEHGTKTVACRTTRLVPPHNNI
jgi:hypothetical protein